MAYNTLGGEAFEVSGRGELQMGVLIENMRREGFELSISRPRVIFQDIDGVRNEPIEEVTIDVDEDYSGAVIDKLTGERKGELVEMKPAGVGKTRIIAHVPSRGLIGYQGQFLTDTRGTGVLNRIFHGWTPHKGPIQGRRQGVLISTEAGVSVAYALWNLEDRGRMFIGPQEQVYVGMLIGEHSRENDLEVNPLKGKKLTNVRASGTDEAVRLTPHIRMSLEEAIAYIDDVAWGNSSSGGTTPGNVSTGVVSIYSSRWAFAAIVWIIVVGALALAAILIGGAVFGYATVPRVAPVGITVERQTPWCTAWSAGFSQATSARSASSPKRGTMGWTLGG